MEDSYYLTRKIIIAIRLLLCQRQEGSAVRMTDEAGNITDKKNKPVANLDPPGIESEEQTPELIPEDRDVKAVVVVENQDNSGHDDDSNASSTNPIILAQISSDYPLPPPDYYAGGLQATNGLTFGIMVMFAAPEISLIRAIIETATGREPTTVIGRVDDLKNLGPNEQSLLNRLPNQESPRANLAQNSGGLRQEMNRGLPIRDASPGNNAGQFLNAERNLLQSRGWTFDSTTNFWNPPVGGAR